MSNRPPEVFRPEQIEYIRLLEQELAITNREVLAITCELDKRVEQRTLELTQAQDELTKANSDLLQLTRELEQRVDERTAEIQKLNSELEQRIADRTSELTVANEELESFSYSVSHDLRAPLRSLDGFSQKLLEDYQSGLDEAGRDYLKRIRVISQRMTMLIDEMLKLSRVTQQKMRIQEVDLSSMILGILAELQKTEPGRVAEIVVLPAAIAQGDLRLLRIALENLLSNAWKFTMKKSIANIEFGLDREGTEPVYFIRDNGAGFEMEHCDKLFRPFSRLHSNASFPGTGIGLAIVKRIINRHGGRIWAEGVPDSGATFFFTLPVKSES